MAIILEGFDGAGKSTLASKLRFPVKHAGGPPKDEAALKACLVDQMMDCGLRVVRDRVTCISHQVYGNAMFDPMLMKALHAMLDCKNTVLVYCRPPDDIALDFTRHTIVEHDTAEHVAMVRANAQTFLERYDELMSKVTHVRYDYTKDGDNISFIDGLIYSQVKI